MAVTIKLKPAQIARAECYVSKGKEYPESVKAKTGADIVINTAIFDLADGKICSRIVADGKEYGNYGAWGYSFTPAPVWDYDNGIGAKHFVGAYTYLITGGEIKDTLHDNRSVARMAIGMTAQGEFIILRDVCATKTLAQKMLNLGCMNAINLDGSDSAQILSPQGNVSGLRKVPAFLCLWLKKESTEGNKLKSIYLSPSTQENNIGKGNYGTEEFRMNEICDLLENELRGKYILYRNRASMTLQQVVTDSNAKMADIHVAIHSNATGKDGGARGCETYICAGGGQAEKLANCINAEMGKITANRGVKVNSALYETKKTKCPAIICEVDYHDDLGGAEWIIANKKAIAKALANGIMTFFGDKIQQAENWYDADIAWAKENGIMDGTRPNDPVTRAECVAMIHRAVKQ